MTSSKHGCTTSLLGPTMLGAGGPCVSGATVGVLVGGTGLGGTGVAVLAGGTAVGVLVGGAGTGVAVGGTGVGEPSPATGVAVRVGCGVADATATGVSPVGGGRVPSGRKVGVATGEDGGDGLDAGVPAGVGPTAVVAPTTMIRLSVVAPAPPSELLAMTSIRYSPAWAGVHSCRCVTMGAEWSKSAAPAKASRRRSSRFTAAPWRPSLALTGARSNHGPSSGGTSKSSLGSPFAWMVIPHRASWSDRTS